LSDDGAHLELIDWMTLHKSQTPSKSFIFTQNAGIKIRGVKKSFHLKILHQSAMLVDHPHFYSRTNVYAFMWWWLV
jgi:hypothetical protein